MTGPTRQDRPAFAREPIMALVAGTRLGPYEIAGPLGAGGMDEVSRARDGRLGWTVAAKILPGAADGQRFLLQRPAADNRPPELKIVLDWPALLDGP